MIPYADRLASAVVHYKDIQQQNDPRFAWGRVDDGLPNIPNTAEVLTIFRCAREEYDSLPVQLGLKYLATRVFIHPHKPAEKSGGRWPLTRWLAYGLIGLTQWQDWENDDTPRTSSRLDDPVTVTDAVERCVAWLRDNRVGKGWPDRSGDKQFSLLSTATAIVALERVGRLASEVAEARDHLVDLSHRDGSWPNAYATGSASSNSSPPHTALAVLALVGGDDRHWRAATKGRDWLLKHTTRWGVHTHSESEAHVEPWEHMTFSLGLRACLLANADPVSPHLAPSIAFLQSLWIEEGRGAHQWRGGSGEPGSVHGSHAVVLAYEQLRRAQRRIDPCGFYELASPASTTDPVAIERFRLRFDDAARILEIIDGHTQQPFPPLPLSLTQSQIVAHMISKQYGDDRYRSSIPLAELAAFSDNVKAQIQKLNAKVRDHTDGHIERLVVSASGTDRCALAIRPTSSEATLIAAAYPASAHEQQPSL
jgi:hypothetical protein